VREVGEEFGIRVALGELACVDCALSRGDRPPVLAHVYWAAPLSDEQLAAIRPQPDDIEGWTFHTADQAAGLLAPRLGRRVRVREEVPRQAAARHTAALLGDRAAAGPLRALDWCTGSTGTLPQSVQVLDGGILAAPVTAGTARWCPPASLEQVMCKSRVVRIRSALAARADGGRLVELLNGHAVHAAGRRPAGGTS
jgi:ADP-ribose pyrophosphatase YjhB (NUDIX family)